MKIGANKIMRNNVVFFLQYKPNLANGVLETFIPPKKKKKKYILKIINVLEVCQQSFKRKRNYKVLRLLSLRYILDTN